MKFPCCLLCGREAAKVSVAMIGGGVGHTIYQCGNNECGFTWEFNEGFMRYHKGWEKKVDVPYGCLAVFGELA